VFSRKSGELLPGLNTDDETFEIASFFAIAVFFPGKAEK